MKQQLTLKKTQRNGICLFILLLAFSCETQQLSEKEIQRRILGDLDFIDMLAEVHRMNVKVKENKEPLTEIVNRYTEILSENFDVLDRRYQNFHENVQAALINKEDIYYTKFIEILSSKLNIASSTSVRVMWDAESVCGNPCANQGAATTTVGCISGCMYSEVYCMTHGGTNCSSMLDSCKNYCCDAFCPEPPGMGG